MTRRLAVPRPASVSPRGFVHLGAYREPLLAARTVAEPTVAERTVAEQSHQQLLSRPSNPCRPGRVSPPRTLHPSRPGSIDVPELAVPIAPAVAAQ